MTLEELAAEVEALSERVARLEVIRERPSLEDQHKDFVASLRSDEED